MEESLIKKNDHDLKNVRLQILLIGEVFRSLSAFLHTADALNFLSCNPESYNLKSPWVTMLYNLNLNDLLRSTMSSGACSKVPRSIVFHSIYNLGYNCVHCCIPLTGPLGFFACTNLCTYCSLKTLKESNSRIYVDGSIRFYLSGKKSIITKGRAFLTHPFWISDDDKFYQRFFDEYGGDSYQLAEEIYAEKKFFMDYCTVEMNIPRPRGDKAATIRQMLVTSFGYDAEENVPFDTLRARKLVESEDLPSTVKATHHFTPSDSNGAAQSISTRNTSSAINDGTSPSGTSAEAMQPEWVINLPKSLREMYEDEKERKVKHENLPCLVTSPLREVVVQMHKREGAVIKYLF